MSVQYFVAQVWMGTVSRGGWVDVSKPLSRKLASKALGRREGRVMPYRYKPLTKRELKKSMLAYTPTQAIAFEYFAARHPFWKMKSLHFNRRIGYWVCLVGGVSYHAKPAAIRKGKRK